MTLEALIARWVGTVYAHLGRVLVGAAGLVSMALGAHRSSEHGGAAA